MSSNQPAPAIGARLRQLRLAQGRSLASVAQAVGISSSALSQIETGAMQPSVNRLVEIVGEVGVPVSAIFDDYDVLHPRAAAAGSSEPIPGVRVTTATADAAEAATLDQGVVYRRLTPVGLDGIDLFETIYPPRASSSTDGAMLVHTGYEVGSILRGTLRFEFAEGAVDLAAGDSLAFWATRPHRVVNESADATASAIWLTLRDLTEPA
ncbi:helix-turn-helix domain-containing protein [Microbacterium sp. W1N]|uniref:helix-turn-helix domain-containing protein n=1 Tax=Microbacterium festucae TaxID=2977531 RepID=UPI0021BEDF56|nr:helix-turn-helix domain-containing protein [Microbacterium festucae]MCT9819375.1 helix-turn-helix domain-containing protein [Microbacterium festucae]